MKKKVLGAVAALDAGVQRVMIADGRVARSIQRALEGAGTHLVAEGAATRALADGAPIASATEAAT